MVELTDFQIEAAALAGIGGGSARSDSEAGSGRADENVANPAADVTSTHKSGQETRRSRTELV